MESAVEQSLNMTEGSGGSEDIFRLHHTRIFTSYERLLQAYPYMCSQAKRKGLEVRQIWAIGQGKG